MTSRKKNRKIVKYRSARNINIGMVIFGIILVYIIINVFLYVTQEKLSIYEVVQGSTVSATNHSYSGLIIRKESVGYAGKSGYLNYYLKEGTKVSPITSLYSIDESGTVSQLLKESTESESNLSDENLNAIKNEITTFVAGYDKMDFSDVYSFKYNMESTLLEYINLNALQSLNQSMEDGEARNIFKIYKPKVSGIVEYYTDGMEKLKESEIKKSMFEAPYEKQSYKTNTLVEEKTPIYKVLTSETWNIYVPLTSEEATYYTDTSVVTIRFMKDNLQCRANFDIINNQGEIFGKLTLDKYMVRYSDCRFIDIQIINEEISGLKIPVTSVVEKEFYTVPLEYMAKGGNSNRDGFYMRTADSEGKESITFITPVIYEKDDTYCYLNPDEFPEDNVWLVKEKSNDSYNLKATSPLKGVYNVNLGYCVFEKVHILAQSGNYYIIKAGTANGPAIYDHIVLNSDMAEDNQILMQ